MAFNVFFIITCGAGLANGLSYETPHATQYTPVHKNGDTPIPTSAGWAPELVKRQGAITDFFASTILSGVDPTCGYLSGNASASYTCGGSATCNLWPGTKNLYGVVACCISKECYPRFGCINSRDYASVGFCDEECKANTFILKCTSAVAQFCNTAVWGDVNVGDVYCASRSVSTIQTFYTKYDGQVLGGDFFPITLEGASSFSLNESWRSYQSSHIFSITSQTSLSSKDSSSTSTTSSFSSTSTSPSPNPDPGHVPVGAIVGGVVGGMALLALIGLAIFIIRRRSLQNTAAASSSAPVHTDGHDQAPLQVYYQNTTPLPTHVSEMDGGGKPPPMAVVTPPQSGRDSYVSGAGYETYPLYRPPSAHEMPGNEVR